MPSALAKGYTPCSQAQSTWRGGGWRTSRRCKSSVFMSEVEQLTEAVAFHGEGPVWSPAWGGLKWLDMLAGDVLTLLPSGSVERRSVGAVAAVIRPRAAGGAVVAVERGFAIDEGEGAIIDYLPDVFHDTG